MRRWEVERYTVSQILNALKGGDPDDPHSDGIQIASLEEIEDLWGS